MKKDVAEFVARVSFKAMRIAELIPFVRQHTDDERNMNATEKR